MTVRPTAHQRIEVLDRAHSGSGQQHGARTRGTARSSSLAEAPCGHMMPRRAAADRYTETPISRAATTSTAATRSRPWPAGPKPPSTRNLSASGSRNAPERVVPSRRASQPSRPSVLPGRTTARPSPLGAPVVGDHRAAAGPRRRAGDGDEVGRRRDRARANREMRAWPALRRTSVRRRANEVGPIASVTVGRHDRTGGAPVWSPGGGRRRRSRAPHGACDRPRRRLVVDAVDEDLDLAADERATRGRVIGSWISRTRESLAYESPSTAPAARAGVPSSGENAKNPAQSSAAAEEREQLVVLGLRLAREADDERRTERGVGLSAPDGRRSWPGTGRRSPIASCAAAAARRVLQRQVEVRHDRRQLHIVETSGSFTSDGYR